jgi:hypothetical protein
LVAFNHQNLNSKFNILTFDKLNLNFYHKKSKIKSLSNKKIALVLTGVSFDHGEWLSGWGKKTYRNFLDCFENHFDKIIYPFSEQFEVEVILTTYHSIHEESLLKIYEPKSFLFLDDKKLKMRATYLISVDNVIRKNEEFDFYIFTRFDIKFFDKLTNWNFDFDKLNCLFVENWTKHNETEFKEISDVLFALPHKFLTKFRKSVYDSNIILNADYRGDCTGDLHYIYKYFKDNVGLENIHFIDQSLNYTTAEAVGPNHDANPYFYLTRKHLED